MEPSPLLDAWTSVRRPLGGARRVGAAPRAAPPLPPPPHAAAAASALAQNAAARRDAVLDAFSRALSLSEGAKVVVDVRAVGSGGASGISAAPRALPRAAAASAPAPTSAAAPPPPTSADAAAIAASLALPQRPPLEDVDAFLNFIEADGICVPRAPPPQPPEPSGTARPPGALPALGASAPESPAARRAHGGGASSSGGTPTAAGSSSLRGAGHGAPHRTPTHRARRDG
jgi:DNA polymerase III subunit gamma/tau